MRRRRVLLISCVAVLLALVLSAWLLLRDEAPPDDGDLRLLRRTVTPANNGFQLVDWAHDAVYWPEKDPETVQWDNERFDAEAASTVVQRNAEILKALDSCLECSQFQVPEVTSFDASQPYLAAWTQLEELVASRSRMHLETGRDEEAFLDALRIIRFGSSIEMGQGPLMPYAYGVARRSRGLWHLYQCMRKTTLAPARVKSYLRELEKYPVHNGGIEHSLCAEYALVCDAIRQTEETHPGFTRLTVRVAFKPNQTRRVAAEYFRFVSESAGRDVLRLADTTLRPEGRRWGEAAATGFSLTNHVGRVLLGYTVPWLNRAMEYRAVASFWHRSLPVLLAIKEYEDAQGDLPSRLEDLVPEFLESVPTDPFGGKPMRYSPAKRLLYSIGTDFVDDGGIADDNSLWLDEEPTLRLLPRG